MAIETDRSKLSNIPKSVIRYLELIGYEPDPNAEFPEVKSKHQSTVRNNDFVTHEGLVDMAHSDGVLLTYTEPVQVPDDPKEKPHVFRAIVVTKRGLFSAYGDADPSNVDSNIADAIIRMAETRALSRALRAAVNSGSAALEELSDTGDESVVVE